jgi:hypothetical protein
MANPIHVKRAWGIQLVSQPLHQIYNSNSRPNDSRKRGKNNGRNHQFEFAITLFIRG